QRRPCRHADLRAVAAARHRDRQRTHARAGGAAPADAVPVAAGRARSRCVRGARPGSAAAAAPRLESGVRIAKLLAAVALVVAAVLVALLAADVRSWPEALSS